MARISDNVAISTIADGDILAITDITDSSLDKKITMAQIKTFSAPDITGKQDLITTPVNNDVVLTDVNGQTKDSGVQLSAFTQQGNIFNGNSQLVQLTSAGKYPALDGSLITNAIGHIPVVSSSTASATAEKAITLSGFELVTGATLLVYCSNANTSFPVPYKDLKVSFDRGDATDDYGLHTPTVIGSPTFTGNKFNSNGNTGISYPITSLGTGTWCIQSKFKSTNTTTRQTLFAGGVNFSFHLAKNTDNKILLYLSSNGSTWNLLNPASSQGAKSDWAIDTEYYIRLTFTGTQYLVDWSIDGSSWVNDYTFTNSTSIYNSTKLNFCLAWDNTVPLIGTMDDIQVTVGSSTIITKPNALYLNINSTGAKALKFKDGIAVDATHPAPINVANRKMLVTYDGTDYIIQENAVYGSGWFPVTIGDVNYTLTPNLNTFNYKKIIVRHSPTGIDAGSTIVPIQVYSFRAGYIDFTCGARIQLTTANTITLKTAKGTAYGDGSLTSDYVVTTGYYKVELEA